MQLTLWFSRDFFASFLNKIQVDAVAFAIVVVASFPGFAYARDAPDAAFHVLALVFGAQVVGSAFIVRIAGICRRMKKSSRWKYILFVERAWRIISKSALTTGASVHVIITAMHWYDLVPNADIVAHQ